MKLRSALLPLLAAPTALLAQAPPGYYATIDPSTPSALRATLHQLIDDHLRFPYTSSSTDTWDILNQADENPQNGANVLDVYRNASYPKISGGVGAYNREHTWPKSYGFPNDNPGNYPYTDCHMLMLCDAGYNTARSNHPFDDRGPGASEYATQANNGAGGGSGVYPGNSNWSQGSRWQTWGDRRGDVARALFYADVRYEGGSHGVTGSSEPDLVLTDQASLIQATGGNAGVAYMGLLQVLLQWHALDPVDARERDRNDVVYGYQGNRNPFIDHPEWAACLFAAQCGQPGPPATPTGLFAIAGDGQVALDWADNTEPDLLGYHVLRATTSGGPYVQLTTAPQPASAFTDVTASNGVTWHYVVTAIDTLGNVSPPSLEVQGTPAPRRLVWINELHYENAGGDRFEFVEVAGRAGTSLFGWALIAYDGATGAIYATRLLTGVVPDQRFGFGALWFPMTLQNGAPDGIALVNPAGVVVEFLSYEGALTATNGPAAGMTATAIGVAESPASLPGSSLQRQGTGDGPEDFVWAALPDDTPGRPNDGQRFADR